LEGNQAEVEAETDKKRTVDATVTIPGATKKYEGNHIGQRQCKLLKYKCMSCLCPVYELVANGEGQFDGMDDQKNQVYYKGTFMRNLFNHVKEPPAEFFVGNDFKYIGCFAHGKRHGIGKQYHWSKAKNSWWLYEDGQFKDDKLFDGRMYMEEVEGKYMAVTNGKYAGEREIPKEE